MTENERKAMVAAGLNPDLIIAAASNMQVVAAPVSNTGMGLLKNPFQVPMQFVLNGTIASGSTKTNFFIDDACGLAGAFGQVGTDTGIAFTLSTITPAILKEYLKTHAVVIDGYNFYSSDATLLDQNLRAIYTTLDGNVSSKQMFSSVTVSNMQQNANLLNVNQAFVYTNDCALKIGVTAPASGSTNYVFTMKIRGAVPYGNLDQFLDDSKIPERSKLGC